MGKRFIHNKETIAFGFGHRHQQNDPRNNLLSATMPSVTQLCWWFPVESNSNDDTRFIERSVFIT